ncbi:hypothetical protein [Aeromicrobium sp. Leaf291]|uniref:hypothetical protein n=1 Tax=Aeromicrobium sp. Leaf291 TaxID=1736325 RepID=UPI0006F5EBFC|nr:hypothetical protein [Aeromicrobium sp. Leaf291]KQP81994.1 hypothetical protein ASF35_11070 [Aeromicrobium sp. Leaf291]
MFALTIDQRGSRRSRDGVPELLDALAHVETVRAFERTVGDEVQGLVAAPAVAVEVVTQVAGTGRWWIGVGVGDVDVPTPTSVRAARGPALLAARVAVERAARCTAGVALEAGEGRDPQDALDAETVLQVLGRLVADRSPDGQEAVDVVRRHDTQRAAAEQLGITPQAMSARLQVARRDDEDRLRAVAVRLLARCDEPSP